MFLDSVNAVAGGGRAVWTSLSLHLQRDWQKIRDTTAGLDDDKASSAIPITFISLLKKVIKKKLHIYKIHYLNFEQSSCGLDTVRQVLHGRCMFLYFDEFNYAVTGKHNTYTKHRDNFLCVSLLLTQTNQHNKRYFCVISKTFFSCYVYSLGNYPQAKQVVRIESKPRLSDLDTHQ